MPTKPLPFYEKDARKWADHVSITRKEIEQILKQNPIWKDYSQLECTLWQLTAIVDEIERVLEAKRRK